MANTQKTIDIIFGGVDKSGGAFNSVSGRLDGLQGNIANATQPLADLSASILKLDAALVAGAAAITTYSVKLSNDFGTAFGEIATLIGQPASNLGDFKQQIQDFAGQSTKSLDEITGATYNAISAGVDYADALAVIEQAEQLSIAGKADLDTTTRALVSTMNAFGADMNQAAAYSDTFFTIVQKGQTTLPELADSIGTVAPLAAQAGLSFDELGAAIASITAGAGIKTPQAMSALQAALSNIIKPSKQASDLAADLGIEFNAAALESKGLSGVLDDVRRVTGGNADQMARLFGSVEALKAVLPLTGTSADKFAGVLQDMENKTGSAATASKELVSDLGLLSQTLKNNVNNAFINFGDNITDEVAGSIQSLTSMFGTLADEIDLPDGAFAPVISQFEGLFQDIESKLEIMAQNLPAAFATLDFSDLVASFDDLGGELGDAFRALFGDVDLTTVDGMASAMQTLVDTFRALVDISSGIIDGLEPLFDLIGSAGGEFSDLKTETANFIGQILGLGQTINTLLPLLGGLATAFGTVGTALVTLTGAKGIASLVTQLGGLRNIASAAGKGGFIGAALFGAASSGTIVGTGIKQGIDYVIQALSGSQSLGDLIYTWVNGANDGLDDVEPKLNAAALAAAQFGIEQAKANDTIKDAADFTRLDIDAINDNTAAMLDAKQGKQDLADATTDAADAMKDSAGALDDVADKAKKAGDATKQAAKDSENFRLKMAQLDADFKAATIEANVKLNIAQLDADTKKAVAIIDGLSDTISNSGDLLGTLFGALSGASKFQQLGIQQQIDTVNKQRQQALDQQKRLVDAQIRLVQQQARALSNSNSIINVKADGLAQHLDAIFHEILEAAQVRATQQGLNLLVGLP